MFDATTYEKRRQSLTGNLDSGLVLLMGNEESSMNYRDNLYPFRQDSTFLYFFGIDMPHLAGILDIDKGTATLFGDELTVEHIVWMGPQPTLSELASQVGVSNIAPYQQLEAVLKEAVRQGRTIHFLPPYRAETAVTMSEWLGLSLDELQKNASLPLIRAIVDLRSVKEPGEIAEIEKAVNISGAMHVAAMKAATSGKIETELAGLIQGIAVAAGGALSFSPIVTINGQVLHNPYHHNTLTSGRLVLGDFGAEAASHYAGDITRTYPVDKTFTTRQKEIYQVVLDAQLAALDQLRPGVPYKEVHLTAARTIAQGLKNLGLMKGDVEEAVAQGAHALFFPHGLGHMMGLDVHDMENLGEDHVGYGEGFERSTQFGLKSLRLARPLKPGFVLTVEPGVYFIPELIHQWKEEGKAADFIDYNRLEGYLDFGGVRIEDDVVITQNGYRILGSPIPKTIEEVEEIRRG